MPLEKTLIILKPDCMAQKKAGLVLSRCEAAGLEIAACKLARLSPEKLRDHYAHIAAKPFYPEVEAFMASTPVIIAVLSGPNAIQRVRNLLGPTDSQAAPAGTIRGDHGTDKMRNIAHASDSAEAAAAEIARFFAPGEIPA